MNREPPLPPELWDRIPPESQAAIWVLRDGYERRIATLEAEVAELKERLNRNSQNSSQPPSSDGPEVERKPPRPPGWHHDLGDPAGWRAAPQRWPPPGERDRRVWWGVSDEPADDRQLLCRGVGGATGSGRDLPGRADGSQGGGSCGAGSSGVCPDS